MYHGERFNSISHIVGAVLAAVGLVVLVVTAAQQGDPWKIVSLTIYGVTLFLTLTVSTLFHSMRGRAKQIMRKLDHLSIYALIAGTYTPFTLVTLRGAWGWSIFAVVWGLATVGIVVDSLHRKGLRILQVVIYLVMGWLVLIALDPLLKALPTAGFIWLLLGGCFYTFGLLFYALDKRIRHFHGVWHLFVLAGSASHYFSILFYVA